MATATWPWAVARKSMSRGPYFDQGARWGARMGDSKSIDYMLGILHDPGRRCTWASPPRTWPSAAKFRARCRTNSPWPASSARRRHRCGLLQGADRSGRNRHAQGHRAVPGRRACARRHHAGRAGRHEARVQEGRRHRDGWQRLGHQRRRGCRGAGCGRPRGRPGPENPLARLVGYAHAGVDPAYMGIGPVPATQKVL